MKHLLILLVLVTSLSVAQYNMQVPGSSGYQHELQNAGNGGDEISGLTGIRFNGHSAGEVFGTCVTGAGDLNGDGFPDIAISAQAYSNNKGRVYVYLGSNDIDKDRDVIMTGETNGDLFGSALSSAGDFNGDGFSDLIVGAFNNLGQGAAYIYFGGTEFDVSPDITLANFSPNSYYGTSVACAGDVNGDGYSDVIVGANGYNSNNGRAYIYFGGAIVDLNPDVLIDGSSGSFFASGVAGIGDMNGDGFDDVAVSEYPYSTDDGRAFVYFGGTLMDSNSDLTITGASDQKLSRSIASGDVNGDGYADIILGAPGTASNFGMAVVYLGSGTPDAVADILISPESSSGTGSFGYSTATADINGDCYDDIVVGAYTNNTATGKVYVYWGGTTIDSYADIMYTGNSTNSYFGCSVANVGDLNDDGFDDVIAGATGYNANRGEAILIQNRNNGMDESDITISVAATNIANAGDVNGDGYKDLLAQVDETVKLFYLGPNMDSAPDITFSYSPSFMTTAGDVNGDGFDDIIFGFHTEGTPTHSGTARLFFGGINMDNSVDLTFTVSEDSAYFGRSIAAGDFNNDGFSDVAISAYNGRNSYYTSLRCGYVNIYYGGVNMDNIRDLFSESYASKSGYGYSISFAGDIFNDGHDNLIIGVPYFENGTASFQSTSISFLGAGSGDYFGRVVAGGGDLNGDGFNDIAIGAPYNSAAGTHAGKVYIYFGSPEWDSNSDVTISGPGAYYRYSFVKFAGDVNGDGFDDLISHTKNGYGIYFGGRFMDNHPDILYPNSEVPEPIGDINNDGYDDLATYGYYGVSIYFSSPPPPKPRIMLVEDVPSDEGGQITIKFARSGFDMLDNNTISKYLIQQSAAPGLQGFFWETIDEISPMNMKKYLVTIETPADSVVMYYRIIAQTAEPEYYWVSNIMSGQSYDNLAPSAVRMFRGSFGSSKVTLNWRENREQDLFGYYIYRSPLASINPDEVVPLAVVNDTLYVDNNPPSGSLFYFIRAKDIHGNFSPLSGASNNPLPVELSLFTASAKGNSVELKWRTITEINLANFTIERKTEDETEWINKGEVAASGNSNSTKDYSFTDGSLSPGKYLYRLKITDNDGYFDFSDIIEAEVALPDEYVLYQNYPNPFNPITTIRYSIPSNHNSQTSIVNIKVYDVLGNEVAVLVNEAQAPGEYNINFNAALLSSGIYYYRLTIHRDKLTAGEFTETKKMIVLK